MLNEVDIKYPFEELEIETYLFGSEKRKFHVKGFVHEFRIDCGTGDLEDYSLFPEIEFYDLESDDQYTITIDQRGNDKRKFLEIEKQILDKISEDSMIDYIGQIEWDNQYDQ